MKSVRIKIKGRVQGVYFRANTKNIADKLGVKGYVRNMPDGTVEIEASADELVLDEFIKWCGVGPAGARVEDTSLQIIQLTNNYKDFTIRY